MVEFIHRLAKDHQIFGIHSPDYKHYQIDDMSDLVQLYLETILSVQSKGPYQLAGWSMGGVVAYAVAVEMQRRGLEVKNLVLVDSPAPVTRKNPTRNELALWFVSDLAESTYLPSLNSFSCGEAVESDIFKEAMQKELIPQMDMPSLFAIFEVFAKNLNILHRYQISTFRRSVPCLCVKASLNDEERVSSNATALWKDLLPAETIFTELKGNHHTMLKDSALNKLVGNLNALYSSSLLLQEETE